MRHTNTHGYKHRYTQDTNTANTYSGNYDYGDDNDDDFDDVDDVDNVDDDGDEVNGDDNRQLCNRTPPGANSLSSAPDTRYHYHRHH